jgi:hypothetical protein
MMEKAMKSPDRVTGNMTNELFTLASCQRIILRGNTGFVSKRSGYLF